MGQGAAQQVNGLLKLDAALRQAALIEGVALNQVILEHLGSPFAKLHATLGFHPVADGDDHVQIVVINFPLNLALALLANYPEFPDSWFSLQFTLLEHITHVLVDGSHVFAKQLRHLGLAEPDRLLIQGYFQLSLPVPRDEKLDLLLVRRWHRRHPESQAGKRYSAGLARRKEASGAECLVVVQGYLTLGH